jgi:hypothetical protein
MGGREMAGRHSGAGAALALLALSTCEAAPHVDVIRLIIPTDPRLAYTANSSALAFTESIRSLGEIDSANSRNTFAGEPDWCPNLIPHRVTIAAPSDRHTTDLADQGSSALRRHPGFARDITPSAKASNADRSVFQDRIWGDE